MRELIAHRGWSGIAPENTLSAIRLALEEEKIAGIEIDVHLSNDGIPVVIHDYMLDRTTNGSGPIKDFTVQQLKELDAGSWFNKCYKGEKIPTLEEVIQLVGTEKKLLIELKQFGDLYEGLEEKVIALIEKYNIDQTAFIISFDAHSLLKVKKMKESVQRTMVFYNIPLLLKEQLELLHTQSISINSLSVQQESYKMLQSLTNTLIVWTVDEREEAERILNLMEDVMITTNHPERLW